MEPARTMYDGQGPLSKAVKNGIDNYKPLKLEPYVPKVKKNAPWVIKDGNQSTSNFMAASADRFKNMLGMQVEPDAQPVAQPRAALPKQAQAVQVQPAPAQTPVDQPMSSQEMLSKTPLPKGFGSVAPSGPSTTPAEDDASRAQAAKDTSDMYAKQIADRNAMEREVAAGALNKNLGSLREQAASLSKPKEMTGLDMYNMSTNGQTRGPSYENAMLERKKFDLGVKNREDELKNVNTQIQSITGQRQGDMSDSTVQRGQDQTSDWHKYTAKENADARRQEAAARLAQTDLGKETLKETKANNAALQKERAADKIDGIKYKADSDRRSKALEMAKNKEGVFDRDLANTLYQDMAKQDEGFEYEKLQDEVPAVKSGLFRKAAPAQPAKYGWKAPGALKTSQGEYKIIQR